jgi:hypothetical protein
MYVDPAAIPVTSPFTPPEETVATAGLLETQGLVAAALPPFPVNVIAAPLATDEAPVIVGVGLISKAAAVCEYILE